MADVWMDSYGTIHVAVDAPPNAKNMPTRKAAREAYDEFISERDGHYDPSSMVLVLDYKRHGKWFFTEENFNA